MNTKVPLFEIPVETLANELRLSVRYVKQVRGGWAGRGITPRFRNRVVQAYGEPVAKVLLGEGFNEPIQG